MKKFFIIACCLLSIIFISNNSFAKNDCKEKHCNENGNCNKDKCKNNDPCEPDIICDCPTDDDPIIDDNPIKDKEPEKKASCYTDSDCDDLIKCNGIERCVDGACVMGEPICSDDGLFCNGPEYCDEWWQGSCMSLGDPCFLDGLVCNEETDSCEEPVLPPIELEVFPKKAFRSNFLFAPLAFMITPSCDEGFDLQTKVEIAGSTFITVKKFYDPFGNFILISGFVKPKFLDETDSLNILVKQDDRSGSVKINLKSIDLSCFEKNG